MMRIAVDLSLVSAGGHGKRTYAPPPGLQIDEFFSLPALRKTWKALRGEIRQLSARDAIDWLDWVVTLDHSLADLRAELIAGTYQPTPPTRFEAGKGAGGYRVLTCLNIRDALVYRHICDAALERALPVKVKGAFFSRSHSRTPIGNTFSVADDPSLTFFEVWLRYNEYRTHTLLSNPYSVLVTSDITNYFDSIQHDLLFEYLAPLGLPRKAVGLLGKLLETFRPASGHSPTPRIGLPVDEFDCSRELAHVFLFEHDHRVAEQFGEDNYVRWMDDQNIGVGSHSEARQVANELTRSLAQQRLTLSSAKTRFLTPSEVAVHFQLEANKSLSEWEVLFKRAKSRPNERVVDQFLERWNQIERSDAARKGNWDKVLKRAYAFATQLDLKLFEQDALEHLITYPHLDERVFGYFAKRNRGAQLLRLFTDYTASGENLFELTESRFFEATLLLDPSRVVTERLRELGRRFARCEHPHQTRRPIGRANALLSLYWLDESIDELLEAFDGTTARKLPKEVARAWLAVVAARNPTSLGDVLGALFGHPGDDVARLARFLTELHRGRIDSIGHYRRKRSRWPLRGYYYEARTWLLLELCSQAGSSKLRSTVCSDVDVFARHAATSRENAILDRVRRRCDLRNR